MLDVLRDSYMLHTAKSAHQRFLYYEIIFLTLIVDVFYYNYLWMCAVGAHQKSMHALDNEACTDNASHAFAQSNYFNFCLTRNRLICEFSRFRRNLRMAENCGNSILILYLYCSISWRRILTMQKAHTLHIAVAALPVVVMVHAPQSATAAKAGIDSHTGNATADTNATQSVSHVHGMSVYILTSQLIACSYVLESSQADRI